MSRLTARRRLRPEDVRCSGLNKRNRDSFRKGFKEGWARARRAFLSSDEESEDRPPAVAVRCDLFKAELYVALVDHGFEKPLELQQQCIKCADEGRDVLCQACREPCEARKCEAKSGTGKTTGFVLACLQQVDACDEAGGRVKIHGRLPSFWRYRELA